MPRQKTEPVVLADTSRLTFRERLECQKLGIMADDLPTIYLNNRMEKAEYDSVLGLFLEKMSRRPKAELDEEVQARLASNQGWPKPGPEMTLFGVERRPVIDVNEEFEHRPQLYPKTGHRKVSLRSAGGSCLQPLPAFAASSSSLYAGKAGFYRRISRSGNRRAEPAGQCKV